MTDSAPKLQLSRFFDSPVEAVYSAWTDADQLAQWHAPGDVKVGNVNLDLQVGGYYKIEMLHGDDDDCESSVVTGEYIEIERNKRLKYTWGWDGPERNETLVTIDFIEKEGGTEILLQHERFVSVDVLNKHEGGWNGCIDNLALYLKN